MSADLELHENDLQVLWGAAAIAKEIGRSKRQVFHLLATKQLKGAKLIGGRWCITRNALRANFLNGEVR